MNELSLIQKITVWALPVIFAITVHEVAHGWVANYFGDATAKRLGRLTLNPIKHIDPIGTILVPAILLYVGGFIFGWAKPVPIDWRNLRNPRRDMALVALAGPMSNLLMALVWGLLAKLGIMLFQANSGDFARYMIYVGNAGILINVILFVLNLLPIPPLDGSRVLSSVVSPKIARLLAEIEIYGFLILVLLLASGVLMNIIGPPISLLATLIQRLYGI